jgi:queuine tRNA-ribosyltransferase
MPVGTAGTVKALKPDDVEELGAQIILANTYHLYLRPGHEIIRKAGGLHTFMHWERPILTDSGGFQVFSLSSLGKISEEGMEFASHIDGSRHLLSPEKSIEIQNALGADIIMAFDECLPYPAEREYAEMSLARTTRWLKRCKEAHRQPGKQALFGIMQGGMYKDLRRESALGITDLDLPGYAIGGLSVGEPKEIMYELLDGCACFLPEEKPRYLMGVGTPVNILEAIERGVDMFDCVMPTRNGRNGMIFTQNGIMNMRNRKWADDFSLLDPEGTSYVDNAYSKAYLRHLFIAEELLAMQIASIHNLAFYLWLVQEARKHIIAGDFSSWKPQMVEKLNTRL